jgi:predicted AAA+ superfamily ATPase
VAGLFIKLSTIETYLKVYLDPGFNGLLIIDEFQYIPGISVMIKLLTDMHKQIKILCTGSSSLDILQKVDESLAGRVRIIEVFSLSFSEFILFNSPKLAELYSSVNDRTEDSSLTIPFKDLLDSYLIFGGLPRAALTQDPGEKSAVLEDIYKTYLMKDVRSYVRNEDFLGFNKLLRMLALQIAGLVNTSELSRESGLSYRKTEEYMSLLEQMYIIRLIPPWHTNKRKSIVKMKKVYFNDLGLRNRVAGNLGEISLHQDKGNIFENYVLLELQRNLAPGGNIHFFRTAEGTEVDFIVDQLTRKMAVECKFKRMDKPVSLRSLNLFSELENITEKYVVNQNLNSEKEGTRFLQGYFAGMIR